MDVNEGGEKALGKRKFDELSEVLDAAVKSKETLVDIPVKANFDVIQENDGARPTEKSTEKPKVEVETEMKTIQAKEAFTPNEEAKVSVVQSMVEVGPKAGKVSKIKASNYSETKKAAHPVHFGPPRRAAGRPPRPKRVIVQALICEKKTKVRGF